jgi:hypothetical protein
MDLSYLKVNLSIVCFLIYCFAKIFLALYNDKIKIPQLKKVGSYLPTVGIQMIGRN